MSSPLLRCSSLIQQVASAARLPSTARQLSLIARETHLQTTATRQVAHPARTYTTHSKHLAPGSQFPKPAEEHPITRPRTKTIPTHIETFLPANPTQQFLGFGNIKTTKPTHMVAMPFTINPETKDISVCPPRGTSKHHVMTYSPVSLSPLALALHQPLSEGMAAQIDGSTLNIANFEEHLLRLEASMVKANIPIPKDFHKEIKKAITELIKASHEVVFANPSQRFFIQPVIQATTPRLDSSSPTDYLLTVTITPCHHKIKESDPLHKFHTAHSSKTGQSIIVPSTSTPFIVLQEIGKTVYVIAPKSQQPQDSLHLKTVQTLVQYMESKGNHIKWKEREVSVAELPTITGVVSIAPTYSLTPLSKLVLSDGTSDTHTHELAPSTHVKGATHLIQKALDNFVAGNFPDDETHQHTCIETRDTITTQWGTISGRKIYNLADNFTTASS
jgi:hypothetical protein